ncbi:cobyrinate a,c-diamide synthase [uncultured Intestinimonas sp.]|uniref:cobyrinate a,c-diamide synthase n=1 Tax=uncultured Intestinimonas sp. TaxID=1689265 RepID=UPI0025F760C6|nr:cobyrinate a,c-diamide synthase [uncultured Intestinimonas sp.]
MSRVPRLLLCAPASGGGKTTAACALLQALVDRGAAPVAFKCGPDYIDPMFHSEVIGAKSRNLDLFLMGEAAVRRSLLENTRGAGAAVIEGAMGYYDGLALSDRASAYDLARTTGTPAVLVADVRGRALSAAALVKGMAAFRPDSRIQGVLLNRCSPMLYPRLREAIQAETGLTVYGYLPDLPACALESRHLGLVTAAEVADLRDKLRRLAAQAEQSVDLDGLLALAASAPALEAPPPPSVRRERRPVIALARDAAFCFYYEDGLEELRRQGAELVEFSPLRDRSLPEGAQGLYLGGGYPEEYAGELARNTSLMGEIHDEILHGMPTVAECGGFLYLHRDLQDAGGRYDWRMAGVFSSRAWGQGKLGRFGYVTLTARKDGLLCGAGERLPAHEFHYWESQTPGTAFRAQKPLSERGWDCGWHTPTLYAGFPHFHFSGCPEAARRFVAACARYERGKEE